MRGSGQSHWKEGKSSAHSLHARPLFLYACGLGYRHTLGLKKDAGSPAVCMHVASFLDAILALSRSSSDNSTQPDHSDCVTNLYNFNVLCIEYLLST